MPLFNRIAFEKEIEIAGMQMESSISDIISLNDIALFTESEENSKSFKEKVKSVTDKIISEIKKFFTKIKDTISKKVKEIKKKLDIAKIERMWKENINNIATVADYADEYKLKEIYGDVITLTRKYVDKMFANKNNPDKVDAIFDDYKIRIAKYEKEIDETVETIRINLRKDYNKLEEFNKSLSDFEDVGQKAVDALGNMYLRDMASDKDDSTEVEPTQKASQSKIASIIGSIQGKVATIGKKIASLVSRNTSKLIAAISALGAGVHLANKA